MPRQLPGWPSRFLDPPVSERACLRHGSNGGRLMTSSNRLRAARCRRCDARRLRPGGPSFSNPHDLRVEVSAFGVVCRRLLTSDGLATAWSARQAPRPSRSPDRVVAFVSRTPPTGNHRCSPLRSGRLEPMRKKAAHRCTNRCGRPALDPGLRTRGQRSVPPQLRPKLWRPRRRR